MRENSRFGAGMPQGGSFEGAVPADERSFFESFYAASVRGTPTDRQTIGPVTERESRFHYNAVENSILKVMARMDPVPEPAALVAWTFAKKKQDLALLDIGSGTGHWIDFGLDVLLASRATGIELVPQMVEFLRGKYAARPEVDIESADIVEADLGGPYHLITAIGVMFHIVDDERWERAIGNLARVMAPGGLAFFGGDFGTVTADRQVMRTDAFKSWKEYRDAPEGPAKVTRRVRSLARWTSVAVASGLEVVDVVRTDRAPELTVPENDVLVLRRPR